MCLLSESLGKTIREASIACPLKSKGPWALSANVQSKQMSKRHGHLRIKSLKLSAAGSSKSVGKCQSGRGNQVWAENKSLGSAPTTEWPSDLYLDGGREGSVSYLSGITQNLPRFFSVGS